MGVNLFNPASRSRDLIDNTLKAENWTKKQQESTEKEAGYVVQNTRHDVKNWIKNTLGMAVDFGTAPVIWTGNAARAVYDLGVRLPSRIGTGLIDTGGQAVGMVSRVGIGIRNKVKNLIGLENFNGGEAMAAAA